MRIAHDKYIYDKTNLLTPNTSKSYTPLIELTLGYPRSGSVEIVPRWGLN